MLVGDTGTGKILYIIDREPLLPDYTKQKLDTKVQSVIPTCRLKGEGCKRVSREG